MTEQAQPGEIYKPVEADASETVHVNDGGGVSLFKKVTVPAQWCALSLIRTKEDIEPVLRREAEQLYFQQGWVLDRVEKVVPERETVVKDGVTYSAWSIYCFGHKSFLAIGSRDALDGRRAAGTKDMLSMLQPKSPKRHR